MPAGQTVINYNGITITNCVTELFVQEAVFDDSGTDLLYHRFTIEVSGFVSGKPPSASIHNSILGTGSTTSPDDPVYQEVAIRAALLEPRKEFVMTLGAGANLSGGTLLLRVLPYPVSTGAAGSPAWKSASPGTTSTPYGNPKLGDRSGYDLNNGPKCLSCSISQISGNTLFRIHVRFEVCKLECDQHGQATNNNRGVLSNRWSVADDIDENFLTTRRFQGVLRVMTANVNAHEFRTVVVPPLQAGFYRKSMSFTASEDGLKLAYTVIDRETVWAAPKPATKWHLRHQETSGGATGQTVGEATCELWGDRNTDDQRVLLKTAIAIVMSKLYFVGGVATIPDELTAITEYGTDHHSVSVYMRVTRPLLLHNFIGMMHETLGTGVSPANPNIAASPAAGYDPNLSRGSRPGETIEVQGPLPITTAWRAYLQSPCDEDHAIDLARNATPEAAKPSGTEYALTISPASAIADTPASYVGSQHKQFPYTSFDMESLYDCNNNAVAMPVAAANAYVAGPTQVVVTLAPPSWSRIIRISATRVGKEPDMPQLPKTYPMPSGTGRIATLVGNKKFLTRPPTKTIDGQNVYHLDVDVKYALSNEPQPGDAVPIGFLAWQTPGVGYRLPASTFNVPTNIAGIV